MCPNPGTEHSGVSFRMKAFSYQGQTFLFHLGVSQSLRFPAMFVCSSAQTVQPLLKSAVMVFCTWQMHDFSGLLMAATLGSQACS